MGPQPWHPHRFDGHRLRQRTCVLLWSTTHRYLYIYISHMYNKLCIINIYISYYADICWLFNATRLIGFWKWLEPEFHQQRRRLPVDPPRRCGDWCTFSCPRLGVWKDRGVIGKPSWVIEDISIIVIYCNIVIDGKLPFTNSNIEF